MTLEHHGSLIHTRKKEVETYFFHSYRTLWFLVYFLVRTHLGPFDNTEWIYSLFCCVICTNGHSQNSHGFLFLCSDEVIKDISVLQQKNDDIYNILFAGFHSFDPYGVLSVDTYGEMNNQIC